MTLVGPLGLTVSDSALEQDIRAGMSAVEQTLVESTRSPHRVVGDITRHLASAGGKRFRPLLTLLAAQFGDSTASGIVPSATAIELTHLATLYHDDVMDSAQTRRGIESANVRWGNIEAILAGDILLAKANALLAELGARSVAIHAATAERLVSGQLREVLGVEAGADPVAHYLSVIADKTGALIAAACSFGAMHAGVSPEDEQRLTEFGEQIGIAFQIADDLLDVVGERDAIGKTPGTDLREGVATLPVLYARESRDPADRHLLELLSGELGNDERREEALRLLRQHVAVDRARADVRAYAERARTALLPLAENPAKTALMALCDAASERVR